MKLEDLADYVAHFQKRTLQDALTEATAAHWRKRAETFAAAMPRRGDYPGRLTPEQIDDQRQRLAATVLACRQRAEFMLGGGIE